MRHFVFFTEGKKTLVVKMWRQMVLKIVQAESPIVVKNEGIDSKNFFHVGRNLARKSKYNFSVFH